MEREDSQISRRHFLRAITQTGAAFTMGTCSLPAGAQVSRLAQGSIRPDEPALERLIQDLIRQGHVPAAQLCVSKDGQIVVNRTYGWLDPDSRIALPTNGRLIVASLDKAITRTAIELLCARQTLVPGTDERFSMSLRPFSLFRQLDIAPPDGHIADVRLLDATVEHLLKHQVGLDSDVQFCNKVQECLGLTQLPTIRDAMRYHYYRRLDRPVGISSEYSSAGYMVLRCLIDLAGGGYINYLQQELFGPAGTKDICLSRTRLSERDPLEVRYRCANYGPSIFPEERGATAWDVNGGNGHYLDYHLVLAASAEAMAKYLCHWQCASENRLWTTTPAQLAPGLNNGCSQTDGETLAIRTAMEQRRWSMCNYVLLMNWPSDGANFKSADLHLQMDGILKRAGW